MKGGYGRGDATERRLPRYVTGAVWKQPGLCFWLKNWLVHGVKSLT